MPNKHNDDRHHHILKMKFKVTNWATCEAGLRRWFFGTLRGRQR
jgi:hypothetical protein